MIEFLGRRRGRLLSAIGCLVLTLLAAVLHPASASQVAAAELLDAKVEYTADFYVTSNAGSYQGTVIHAPGRERRDFETASGRQSLLLRRDRDQAAMLWPDRKWFISTSFQMVAGLVGGFDGVMLDRRLTGHEIVGGEPTTRYDVTVAEVGPGGGAAGGRGGGFKGRIWLSKDGILMRLAGKVVFSGRETSVETGLLNMRRLKADPAAFLVPSDYSGLPIDFSKLGLR